MADLGTPAAGAMTPNPATTGTGKQPLVYICGGTSKKICVDLYLGPVQTSILLLVLLVVQKESFVVKNVYILFRVSQRERDSPQGPHQMSRVRLQNHVQEENKEKYPI